MDKTSLTTTAPPQNLLELPNILQKVIMEQKSQVRTPDHQAINVKQQDQSEKGGDNSTVIMQRRRQTKTADHLTVNAKQSKDFKWAGNAQCVYIQPQSLLKQAGDAWAVNSQQQRSPFREINESQSVNAHQFS